MFQSKNKLSGNRSIDQGFTLVEILISISIMAIFFSITLYDYGSFSDNLALSSAGQEISLAIRQVQDSGINVKSNSSGDFSSAYGIYFSTTDPTNYYFFVDNKLNSFFV